MRRLVTYKTSHLAWDNIMRRLNGFCNDDPREEIDDLKWLLIKDSWALLTYLVAGPQDLYLPPV